jgi:hypothetical protein
MKVRDCNNTVLLSLTDGSRVNDYRRNIRGSLRLTQILDIEPGTHNYDIEITDSAGIVKTWIAGKLIVIQDQTY